MKNAFDGGSFNRENEVEYLIIAYYTWKVRVSLVLMRNDFSKHNSSVQYHKWSQYGATLHFICFSAFS